MKLLDGKHRWLAYRKRYPNDDREVNVLVYPVTTPHEQLKLATKLNSDHGFQLSISDKESDAKALYAYGCTYEDIASCLSVSKCTVSGWLARTVKDNKEKRDKQIFDMWLACYTEQEIADSVGITKQAVGQICKEKYTSTELYKPAYLHQDESFEVPLYNVWKQQTKTDGSKHFGNSEVRWLDNLLYLYTNPADIVIDPFAGGGSTIDLCKRRYRRYFVSDRLPIVEREKEIRKHDLTDGLPKPPNWEDVSLVYLDPPYWKQAEGQYSNDSTDLANMEVDQFHQALSGIINEYGKKIGGSVRTKPAYIAMLMQSTQWKAPDHVTINHAREIDRSVKLPLHRIISAPYESQQCTAQMVDWAKANNDILEIARTIYVWRAY
jgi:predicted transcriptional regulator